MVVGSACHGGAAGTTPTPHINDGSRGLQSTEATFLELTVSRAVPAGTNVAP